MPHKHVDGIEDIVSALKGICAPRPIETLPV
jgi:hypothetical protein